MKKLLFKYAPGLVGLAPAIIYINHVHDFSRQSEVSPSFNTKLKEFAAENFPTIRMSRFSTQDEDRNPSSTAQAPRPPST